MSLLAALAVYLWAAFVVALAETAYMGPPDSWPYAVGGWLAWPLWPLGYLIDRYLP